MNQVDIYKYFHYKYMIFYYLLNKMYFILFACLIILDLSLIPGKSGVKYGCLQLLCPHLKGLQSSFHLYFGSFVVFAMLYL